MDHIASDTHGEDARKVALERASKIRGFDKQIHDITALKNFAASHAPFPCKHSDFVDECACCWFWMIYQWTRDML